MEFPTDNFEPRPELGVLYNERRSTYRTPSVNLVKPKSRSKSSSTRPRPFAGPRIIRAVPWHARLLAPSPSPSNYRPVTPSLPSPESPGDEVDESQESPSEQKVLRNAAKIKSTHRDDNTGRLILPTKRKQADTTGILKTPRKRLHTFAGGVDSCSLMESMGLLEIIDLTRDTVAPYISPNARRNSLLGNVSSAETSTPRNSSLFSTSNSANSTACSTPVSLLTSLLARSSALSSYAVDTPASDLSRPSDSPESCMKTATGQEFLHVNQNEAEKLAALLVQMDAVLETERCLRGEQVALLKELERTVIVID